MLLARLMLLLLLLLLLLPACRGVSLMLEAATLQLRGQVINAPIARFSEQRLRFRISQQDTVRRGLGNKLAQCSERHPRAVAH